MSTHMPGEARTPGESSQLPLGEGRRHAQASTSCPGGGTQTLSLNASVGRGDDQPEAPGTGNSVAKVTVKLAIKLRRLPSRPNFVPSSLENDHSGVEVFPENGTTERT